MEKRQRIDPGKDLLMKLFAVGFDAIGFVLIFTGIGSSILGIFGNLTFFIWYLIIGSPIFSTKSIKLAGTNFILELIPILNTFWPGFSILVWRKNSMVMKEDEEYNKREEEQEKSRRSEQQKKASYQEQNRQQKLQETNYAEDFEQTEDRQAA